MHLRDEQVARIAEKVMADLTASGLIQLKAERGALINAIKSAISTDLRAEESLEKDAEALLEKTLRATGGDSSIDRHKMLRMIKEKLAKERKIVL